MTSTTAPAPLDLATHPMPATLARQPRAARTLAAAIDGSGAHAWLLAGPRGTGTLEAAEWMAAGLLFSHGGGDIAALRRRVERRVHPDLIWVRGEGDRITMEQVEDLTNTLVRTPFEADVQVVVLEDADTLSAGQQEAGNAMLKLLEEPPGNVVFLLLSDVPGRLLPTIRSRVSEVQFVRLPDADIAALLVEAGHEPAAAGAGGVDVVARLARGEFARAVEFVQGGPARERHDLVVQVGTALASGGADGAALAGRLRQRLDRANAAARAEAEAELNVEVDTLGGPESKDGKRFLNSKQPDGYDARARRRGRRGQAAEVRQVAHELSTWYRDLAAVAAGADDTVAFVDQLPTLQSLRHSAAARAAVPALDTIAEWAQWQAVNVDNLFAVQGVCGELASMANGRVRARRAFGA